MTLDEATKMLEFKIDRTVRGQVIEVCSGGTRNSPKDPVPALCDSEETAAELWFDEMQCFAEAYTAGYFVRDPKMERFQMTEMGPGNTQRLTKERFAVTSAVEVPDDPA